MYVCIYIYIYIHIHYICACVCVYIQYICVCIYIIYICVCVYTCTYMRKNTHTLDQSLTHWVPIVTAVHNDIDASICI